MQPKNTFFTAQRPVICFSSLGYRSPCIVIVEMALSIYVHDGEHTGCHSQIVAINGVNPLSNALLHHSYFAQPLGHPGLRVPCATAIDFKTAQDG